MFRIGKEEIEAVTRVIESGELFRINNNNREVDHFEEELAASKVLPKEKCYFQAYTNPHFIY